MRLFTFSLVFFSSLFSYAQCDGLRYRELVFASVAIDPNVVYGSNQNYLDEPETLTMDVYEPTGDTQVDRPLVIVAHGGFFFAGSSTGADVVPLCTELAKMGYVVASINYRKGFPLAASLAGPMTTAVLRGTQDAKAAIRWFRKNVAENGNTYNINPENIYLGGVSAGGYIAMHHAYLDNEAELPSFVDLTAPGAAGGLEGESGNPGYPTDVVAVFNIAGALGDTAWIQPGDEPCLLFHGTDDTTVPFGSAIQTIFGVVSITEVDGSSSVAERLTETGIEHCFEIYEGQNHVPHVDQIAYFDTTLSIVSNFLSHFVCDVELECGYRELAVSTAEITAKEEAFFYPNPASDYLRVNGIPNNVTSFTFSAVDGKQVELTRLADGSLNLSDLARGMYVVSWKNKNHEGRTRVVIE